MRTCSSREKKGALVHLPEERFTFSRSARRVSKFVNERGTAGVVNEQYAREKRNKREKVERSLRISPRLKTLGRCWIVVNSRSATREFSR